MKNKYPIIFNFEQSIQDWDEWLMLVEERLTILGYRKYNQNLKNEDFAYWKTFRDEGKKAYMVGVNFYDFRKYRTEYNAGNRIGIQYQCILLGHDRIEMDVSKHVSLDNFKIMATKFYQALKEFK